jgi:hypothetical protein
MVFARKIINASAFWVSKAKTALKDFAPTTAMEMENALKINAYVILAGWEQVVKTAFALIIAEERKREFANMENAYAKKDLQALIAA